MSKIKTKPKTTPTERKEEPAVAVLVRFHPDDLRYMRDVTLANTNAQAVSIFCRMHIGAAKKGARAK